MAKRRLSEIREQTDARVARSIGAAEYAQDYLQRMSGDGRHWTPEEDALLGTDTDRVIAQKLNRSSVAVSNRRKKLGIPRARSA